MSTPQLPASMLNWHPHPDGSSGWLPPGSDVAVFTALADARLAAARAEVATARLAVGVRQQVLPLLNYAVSQAEEAGLDSHAAVIRSQIDQLEAALAELAELTPWVTSGNSKRS